MVDNIYIITCDKTNWVLKITVPLLEKYWTREKTVKILGFNDPGIMLPDDYKFISMKPKQLSIDDWAKDIHSVMVNDPNKYVIMMLDDFLPLDHVNPEIFDLYYSLLESDINVVRCPLGSDLQFLPHTVIERKAEYDIIEQKQTSSYRITTQPSIWRKEYLLKYLRQSKSPWHFETAASPADGKRMISTIRKYAYCCMCESAISGRYPGKFNVLGMKFEDLKPFIDSGLLKEDNLQFGIHLGRVPQFKDYRYDFNMGVIKNYVDDKRYNEYYIRYHQNYASKIVS
jgi:hypothetical protein